MKSKKQNLLEDLIRLHHSELKNANEMIARLGSSSSFETAVANEKARLPRLHEAIQRLEKNREDFAQPKSKIEVGAMVGVESSQYGERFYLIVDQTEIPIVDPKHYQVFSTKRADFPFANPEEERIYKTGRPGEEFEVKEKVVSVQ